MIGNPEKDNLVPTVLHLPIQGLTHTLLQRQPIPGTRLRTRAFIKVQDGCDNYCTYCITRLARGVSRSRKINDILEDIQSALDGGTQEVVLTGVHLGSWGYDFDTPSHLSILVSAILTQTDIPRVRLSSLEPWDISPDFFELWQNRRLCRHLHLPLQSGCEATLKRMGRRTTPKSYANLISQARALIPDLAITTDIITGFPGETDEEFSESASFIQKLAFAHGHVFTYSARPGTPAAQLPDQVPHRIAKQRNAIIREIIQVSAHIYKEKHLGQVLPVLWEKATLIDGNHWKLSGLSDNYLRINTCADSPCRNNVTDVYITGLIQGEMIGEIRLAESR